MKINLCIIVTGLSLIMTYLTAHLQVRGDLEVVCYTLIDELTDNVLQQGKVLLQGCHILK